MAQRRKSWLGVGVKVGLKKLGKIRARRTKERQKEGAGRHELVENQIPSPGVPLAPSLTVVTTAAATIAIVAKLLAAISATADAALAATATVPATTAATAFH